MTVITIDGPSGSGKGTVVMALAKELGFDFLDSGALYRLVALQAMRNNIALDDEVSLEVIALDLPVQFLPGKPESGAKAILDGSDVSNEIRTEQVAAVASKVACLPKVREALLERQRAFDKGKGLIADGRDMGTVVFPDAPYKVFLTASAEERAKRRVGQLLAKGENVKMNDVLCEINARDERDKHRGASPLRAAEDAITLDTSNLSADMVVDKVKNIVTEMEKTIKKQ